jgi:hypothetical protein
MEMPMKVHDLTGRRFGRVTVLEFVELNNNGGARWRCRCDCGTVFETNAASLVHGHTKSCGCYRKEISRERVDRLIKARGVPVVAVINGEKREFKSIKSVSRHIGCAASTVRLAIRKRVPFRGIEISAKNR